jgi:hypothetical protein
LHGLVWSRPFVPGEATSGRQVSYLAKLGLEIAGIAKEGRGGSRTPWELARAAAGGDSRALWLWREYCAATKGRRMLELDDRAQTAAKRALEVASVNVKEGETLEPPQRIEVKRDDVRALRQLERRIGAIMCVVLRAAEEQGASGVREWVAFARADQVRRAELRERALRLAG